jgi:hypothetical protein
MASFSGFSRREQPRHCTCQSTAVGACWLAVSVSVCRLFHWFCAPAAYCSNYDAPVLLDDDVDAMKSNIEVGENLILSYDMMLDFFGMKLLDVRSGAVGRSEQFESRYHTALEMALHNHLRLCRVLSCFSVLGFRTYKHALVKHLLAEVESGKLRISPSSIGMFMTYIREDSDAYARYTKIRLPEDHAPHAIFKAIADRAVTITLPGARVAPPVPAPTQPKSPSGGVATAAPGTSAAVPRPGPPAAPPAALTGRVTKPTPQAVVGPASHGTPGTGTCVGGVAIVGSASTWKWRVK